MVHDTSRTVDCINSIKMCKVYVNSNFDGQRRKSNPTSHAYRSFVEIDNAETLIFIGNMDSFLTHIDDGLIPSLLMYGFLELTQNVENVTMDLSK